MPASPSSARLRPRRPLLALASVVGVLLAMRLVGPYLVPGPAATPTAASPSGPPDRLDRPAGQDDLLLGGEEGLFRVDLDGPTVRRVRLPGLATGAVDAHLVRGTAAAVVVQGGTAYAVPVGLDRPATRLGAASFVVPAATGDRVWLVAQSPDPERWFTVREVGLDGRPTSRPGTLPLGRRPLAGVPGGLLVGVTGPDSSLVVWDPSTGRTGRRLGDGTAVFVAASPPLVAWLAGASLHLTDLRTGGDRVVPPPPEAGEFTAGGAFSPDGRTLAVITSARSSSPSALVLVDVDRARAVRVAGSDGALWASCAPCLGWSAAGGQVLFARLWPNFAVGTYRLGADRAVAVRLEVPGVLPPSFVAL